MKKIKSIFTPEKIIIIVFLFFSFILYNFINSKSLSLLFNDQWDFYTPLFENKNLIDVFRSQHSIHRQGLAFVIDKFLLQVTSWNIKVEPLFIGTLILLAGLFALVLKKRLFGKFAYTDIIIPIISLTLAQWEIFIIAPNPSAQAFPLLFVFLYVLSWSIRNQFWKYTLVLITNFLLIYSGYGFFIGIITIILLAVDTYYNFKSQKSYYPQTFVSLILAILSFGSFFVGYTFTPAVSCFKFPWPRVWEYPIYSSLMFSTFISSLNLGLVTLILSLVILGVITYVCLVSLWRLIRKGMEQDFFSLTLFILFGFSLLFVISTAIGRICLGFPSLYAPRYVTYLLPAYIGIYFYFLSIRSARLKVILIIIYLAFTIISNYKLFHNWETSRDYYADGEKLWAECYKETENIEYCDKKTNFKVYPDEVRTHLKFKLDYMKERKLNLFSD